MAKKGFDIKALLLNHGEKFGAGLIGLIAITGLASASWAPCKEDQLNLVKIAQDTEAKWLSNPYDPEKAKEFDKTPDVEGLAVRMSSPNEDIAKFSTSRRWNPPIYQVQSKMATVTVLAPEDPESELVTFPLVEAPDEEADDLIADASADKKKEEQKSEVDENLAEIFGKKSNESAVGSGFGDLGGGESSDALGLSPGGGFSGAGMRGGSGKGMGSPGMGAPGMGAPGMGSNSSMGSMRGPGGAGNSSMGSMRGGAGGKGMGSSMGLGGGGLGMGMGYDDGAMDGYGGGYGGDLSEEKKVRLVTGVSVRLVFDIRKQTLAVAEALHMPPSEAGRYIDFVNLQIERKRAINGTDPWAGEWEPLTLDEVGEILEKSLGTDPDIVHPSVIRPEITMPLPRRRTGEWVASVASHRRLENFELDADERAVIELHNQKLLEEAKKRQASLPPEQARSEGFRRFQLGTQDLEQSLGGATDNIADQLFADLNEPDEGEKKDSKYKDKKKLRELLFREMAAQRLLLVRFMDFTCDRGTSYQYRVRLEMRNPNFNRPIDELEQPEQADRPTIFSAWSAPTPPVLVPVGYRYYPQQVSFGEMAKLTMYFENESAGTPALAPSIQVPVGSRIGGRTSVDVVDLGKDTLKNQEVQFKSQDFLASVVEAPRISKSDFPELKAYFDTVKRPFRERITVIDSNGAIVVRYAGDSVMVGDKRNTATSDKNFIDGLHEMFKDWRDEPATGNSFGSDPYAGEDDGAMGGSGLGMGGAGYGDFSGGMSGGGALGARGGAPGGKGGGGASRGGGGRGGRGGMR